MRVTHVITRLIVGGAQENTIDSVLGLQRKPGMEISLISGAETGSEGSLREAFKGSPSTLITIPDLIRSIHPWKDFVAMRRLTKLFQEQRPDIVHTHSGKAGVLGRLAAHKAGVPVIIHTIHGPSFGAFQGPLANALFRSAERRAGKITTHFVVVADAMTCQYLAAGIGTPVQYTKVLSGFALPTFMAAKNDVDLRAKYGFKPEDIVIGKLARFFKLKGHEDLFKIARPLVEKFPNVKFLLVGDGPWRAKFERLAVTLGLEKHFAFTGLVPPTEIPQLLGLMDIVAHLSLREGLARALPQAMAAGKPVVAYDCDGASEVVRDGETGFLVRPGDLIGLEQRLQQLAGDAGLRERLGHNGREFVLDRFSVKKMVDNLFALYLKLVPASKMPTT